MKLYYWKKIPEVTNFGDLLSPWIWRRELPDFFDEIENELFLGIGTILDNTVPVADRYVVMGAGAGYHEELTIDNRWKFYAVRGPLTARKYGLEEKIALTDPAVLIGKWFDVSEIKKTDKIGFIPHWSTATCDWERVCKAIGIEYVDPKWPVESVLLKIAKYKLIISESLHGAIVADTLRTPWIAVQSNFKDYSEFKWNDWKMSMGIRKEINKIRRPWGRLQRDDHAWKKILKIILGKVQIAKSAKIMKDIIDYVTPTLSKEELIQQKTDEYEKRKLQMKKDM